MRCCLLLLALALPGVSSGRTDVSYPHEHEEEGQCQMAQEEMEAMKPSFDEHVTLVQQGLSRARRGSRMVMGGRRHPDVDRYVDFASAAAFLEMSSSPASPAGPGVIDQAGQHLGQIAAAQSKTVGKWSYGHCVCEVCHNIMEQLQVKMFADYGYDFTDADIHDVLEDSFCDSVLPYYKSPCQFIMSYRYHSLASMVMYMIPYDICQTQRMCMGKRYSPA